MKIFFTCSKTGRQKYKEEYARVLTAISEHDVEIVATEDDSYRKIVDKISKKAKKQKYIYDDAIKRAIFEVDAVIIDNTQNSFRLGHEATIAMMLNKPVLILSRHKDYSKIMHYKNFHAAQYDEKNLQYIIDDFIYKVGKKTLSVRFNMYISKEQKEYLWEKTSVEKIKMSEYVRRLIDKDREKESERIE